MQMPDLSVIDISEALGYRDPAHFSRQFKKWTENTPYQYRKSHQ
ncbi:helix-turn-helix domain-containing protein [Leuconostoc mesenteroides]